MKIISFELSFTLGFVAQSGMKSDFPLPLTDLFYCNRAWDAKGGKAVAYRRADLNVRNLPVKIARGQALIEQFHEMHPLPGGVMRSMIPKGLFQHDCCGGISPSAAIGRGRNPLRTVPLRFGRGPQRIQL